MSVGASPPQGAPMLSPDGKWVWDGSQWLPLADPSTASHHAVFAAWNAVRVEAPVATEAVRPVPAPPPAPVRAAAPVVDYSAVQENVTPLWQQQPETGLNKYLYIAAGLIVLVVASVALNALVPLSLPWFDSGSSSGAKAAAGPTPAAARTDSERAARYLNGFLTPEMSDFNQTLKVMRETCVGPLTLSCQNAITATDKQASSMITVIDREPIPLCIATPVAKIRLDLSKSRDALQLALKGYGDNQGAEVAQGLSRFAGAIQPLQADVAAASAATPTCDIALVGP